MDYLLYVIKDPFVFRCRALMIAAFNSLPRTADTTEGFFSRWVVVPFSAFFPAGRADPGLIERLTTLSELRGLLRVSIGGLQQVMRRGAFTLPKAVQEATARFKNEADPVRAFVEERVMVADARKENAWIARAELYGAYVSWSMVNGFHQMSAMKFYEALAVAITDLFDIPLTEKKNNTVKGFSHLIIK